MIFNKKKWWFSWSNTSNWLWSFHCWLFNIYTEFFQSKSSSHLWIIANILWRTWLTPSYFEWYLMRVHWFIILLATICASNRLMTSIRCYHYHKMLSINLRFHHMLLQLFIIDVQQWNSLKTKKKSFYNQLLKSEKIIIAMCSFFIYFF